MSSLSKAWDARQAVGWRTFLVPSELFHATGVVPLTPEVPCAVLARNQAATTRIIECAEEQGYDARMCSFLKVVAGGAHQGFLPTPDIVVGSPCFCSGIGSVLHDVARLYGRPFFYLNLPLHDEGPAAVEFVAGQLRCLVRALCECSGADLGEVERERLPLAVERAGEAARYWKEIGRLRQATPSPMTARDALDFATVLSQAWGSEEIIEIYRLLRDELAVRVRTGTAAVPGESIRLFWLHLRPYHSGAIMDWIEEAGGAVVFEEVNFPSRAHSDPNAPYTSLALEVLANAGRYRAFDDRWREDIRGVVRDFDIRGVVHFAHENCGWAEAVFPPMHRFLRDDLGLPSLSVGGDCLVRGRDRLLNTRVLAFLESLATTRAPTPVPRPEAGRDELFAGIDVGSTSVKVVLLDRAGALRGAAVTPTGRDNRVAVERALGEAFARAGAVNPREATHTVVTGVGRNNVRMDHDEVTELTCHLRGVSHLLPAARSVLDIGGQDTKAILVDERTYRMSTACAAGTGRFLETIASALGLDLDAMAGLDARAPESAQVSRMCTVFAESEVVSRIACGEDVGCIVRGVHDMVAAKAATLLRQLAGEVAFPVALSGGVAQNGGVVRALRSLLGGHVLVPRHPQHVGALGAALLARERSGALDAPSPGPGDGDPLGPGGGGGL